MRANDQVRRLVRRQGRHVLVHLGRRDHRRAHQGHVDRRELDADVGEFGRGARRPRVQRRLRCDIGGKARRVGQHADRRDVDHVAAAPGRHVGQQPHRQPQRAEVVDLHRALEVVHAVVARFDGPADRAARIVDEDVHAAEGLDDPRVALSTPSLLARSAEWVTTWPLFSFLPSASSISFFARRELCLRHAR